MRFVPPTEDNSGYLSPVWRTFVTRTDDTAARGPPVVGELSLWAAGEALSPAIRPEAGPRSTVILRGPAVSPALAAQFGNASGECVRHGMSAFN